MSFQSSLKQYINSLLQPLNTKLNQLQNQNQQLKRRVTYLESHHATQNNKSYMRNTTSRENHLLEGSRLTRKDEDLRSVSGSKEKPGWQRSTKLGDDKPIVHETTHYYERVRIKPPIPRMNSRTPNKNQNQQDINRQKSPSYNQLNNSSSNTSPKTITNSHPQNNNNSPIQNKKPAQNLASPRNVTKQFDDPSVSNASKTPAIKLGKPNIYIQKQAKLNTVSATSPRQSPLNQSSLTENRVGGGSQVTFDNSAPNLNKSQLSINSEKKIIKVEVQS